MIQCQKCGQGNAEESQFCRYCGNRLAGGVQQTQPAPQNDFQFAPPRPYAWKTDEYQTQSERRVKPAPQNQFQPQAYVNPAAGPLAYSNAGAMAANYRCPNCGTSTLPITERRISTAGWIVFSLLLVFTFIFFWVGLLMKQDVSVCPVCRATLS